MGGGVLDSNLDMTDDMAESAILAEGNAHSIDSRRRLEDKIEELRLRREMQEFDFDFDS
ncbi:PA3496 family putative envelope integrity protein [Saccharophagus degradans]|uniref:Uncharacterized protein n=2 Tax=Saccharophagus degradans TaxID=86304 RepID=Q21IM9_SACD2|nr:hypothetical protein [Saccharophagus degradans]ABD81450.1 hypothetical protein Sde_2190 [Saccharophagus degradans 2-40]MBU2985850.1 hypothetical protein [Saccharophagus degradans]MDO6420999.1 hypothetical protein [Saccharophagus degradans]MDO6606090.1 hypothetical protein [Saccharophagus degradans]WGP00315.1 hypothetical protein QFX18_09680 [Saccharophagus degradans]